ncbi:MAG: hypothetical protein AAGJ54_09715 [Planctomycetota bacterium]
MQIRSHRAGFAGLVAAFAGLALVPASAASANVVWDEDVDGDLSDDQFAPTIIDLGLGSNLVAGRTSAGNPNPDREFFTIEVAAGLELSEVVLIEYDTTSQNSFIAVEAGPQITSLASVEFVLGATLIGTEVGSQEGDNFLDDLGLFPAFGGIGFDGTLGPGQYTFWFQETLDPVDFTFDFVLVPAPASAGLLAGAVLFAGRRRR